MCSHLKREGEFKNAPDLFPLLLRQATPPKHQPPIGERVAGCAYRMGGLCNAVSFSFLLPTTTYLLLHFLLSFPRVYSCKTLLDSNLVFRIRDLNARNKTRDTGTLIASDLVVFLPFSSAPRKSTGSGMRCPTGRFLALRGCRQTKSKFRWRRHQKWNPLKRLLVGLG